VRQEDIDEFTKIADKMGEALAEFREAIRDLDHVIDQSPVQDKGLPMSVEEIGALTTITDKMSRAITWGLTIHLGPIEEIIEHNLTERNGS
jgi:hypothetical protein